MPDAIPRSIPTSWMGVNWPSFSCKQRVGVSQGQKCPHHGRRHAGPMPSHSCSQAYPQEGVQGPVLHKLRDDHDRHTIGDDAVQPDDVGVFKLPHDAGLAEELAALLLRVAPFQRLDGHVDLLLPRHLQQATADLPKLTWKSQEGTQ